MTCSTSGYLTKNIWLIYIIFVLIGIDNNTASGSKFIECKTMCGFSGTPYISQIFGRRLHQKTSIGTCGTFIGWPRAAEHAHSFATGRVQPCVASQSWASHVWWASFYTACRPTGNRGMRSMIGSPCQISLLLVKQNVNILIFFTHLCWWGPNPFIDFPLVTLSGFTCYAEETRQGLCG